MRDCTVLWILQPGIPYARVLDDLIFILAGTSYRRAAAS